MAANQAEGRRYIVGGRVQGVGFRPFVFRLARRFELLGRVYNEGGRVRIEVEGPAADLNAFAQALIADAPPLARPKMISTEAVSLGRYADFEIDDSRHLAHANSHLPPDQFCCDDCLHEMNDPANRRYRYPFINCTQCGPRYTLIERMPYDRANTSMAGFPLCEDCREEYLDPGNRRFHAEPIACPVCGPRLSFENAKGVIEGQGVLDACLESLRLGRIVAVKGIGGYHLMCDAMNEDAIASLRTRKGRPHKPFAVMFPWRGANGMEVVRKELLLGPAELSALGAPARSIVLCERRPESSLPDGVAPGLSQIGAMLPYSPLHHLLLQEFGGPLVATSANISGEPVLTGNEEARSRLINIADAFLHHDRPIVRPADDSVMRVIATRPRFLRLGRGIAPLEYTLPFTLKQPTLAVGGHMKNAIALGWDNRVVLSPHIGDLDSPRSLDVFEQVIADLQVLYGIQAGRVVSDAHASYASSRWAQASGLPLVRVQHHAAHASALAGENPAVKRWLVFAWDGSGMGDDDTLWGGEALLGAAGSWQRVASLRTFRLPGGERAGREPWRSAAGLCWESGVEWQRDAKDMALVRAAWEKDMNAPATSAAGRLFDGAAALLGLLDEASFEGQGPMLLETVAKGKGHPLELPLLRDGVLWRCDWSRLIGHLLNTSLSVPQRAMDFHASLAQALLAQARAIANENQFDAVGLCGGVFQNRRLCELSIPLLEAAGFDTYLMDAIPCNDGGLAFGQIMHIGASDRA